MRSVLYFIGTLLCLMHYQVSATPVMVPVPLILQQNVQAYLGDHPDTPLLSTSEQSAQLAYFKQQYFQPWSGSTSQTQFCFVPGVSATCADVKQTETSTLDFYNQRPGTYYDMHYVQLPNDWTVTIAQNMQLDTFPNIACDQNGGCKGMMVENAQLRSLPTKMAAYKSFLSSGEGYPFDYIQLSDLWLGTPVQMLQYSKDQRWILIKGQGVMGWVPANDVARVSPALADYWQHAAFVTPTARTQNMMIDHNNETLYLGSILPIDGSDFVVPVRDGKGNVGTILQTQSGFALASWPLVTTPRNFAMQIHALLAMPYGWGGKDFHSDCSGTLRRLFLTFGIWLPRSSSFQAQYAGTKISLVGKSASERKAILIDHAGSNAPTPFLTLIAFGHSTTSTSHIGLYLGTTYVGAQQEAVMLNEVWGVSINKGDVSGRAWIGQSAISPVGIGENIQSALAQAGWQLNSLWDVANMSLTTVGTAQLNHKKASRMSSQVFVKQYLSH